MNKLDHKTVRSYEQIVATLKAWRESTTEAVHAINDAWTSGVWKKHHDTWKAFIESCGFTQEWGRQLRLTGQTIVELKALLPKEGECNSVASDTTETLAKVSNLTPGMRRVLDGLPTPLKLETLKDASAGGKAPTVKDLQWSRHKIAAPKAVAKSDTNGDVEEEKPTAKHAANSQGKQKSDPRSFVRLENDLGAMLRKIDTLHRESPNKFHHDSAIALVKKAMTEVKAWQKAVR